jgi:hypothetical protein
MVRSGEGMGVLSDGSLDFPLPSSPGLQVFMNGEDFSPRLAFGQLLAQRTSNRLGSVADMSPRTTTTSVLGQSQTQLRPTSTSTYCLSHHYQFLH